jgi:hypothetical protein
MEMKTDKNLLRAGLKSRYAYAAVFSKVQGKFSGIVKFDLTAKNGGVVVGQIEHGRDRYGGEAVFVNGSGPGESQSCLVSGSQCCLQVFLEDVVAGHSIIVCNTGAAARPHICQQYSDRQCPNAEAKAAPVSCFR